MKAPGYEDKLAHATEQTERRQDLNAQLVKADRLRGRWDKYIKARKESHDATRKRK
jgi:hypothetical protein